MEEFTAVYSGVCYPGKSAAWQWNDMWDPLGPHVLNFADFSVPPAHEAEGFAMATINQAPPGISHLESTLILHSLPHTYVSLGPFLKMFPCFLVFPW